MWQNSTADYLHSSNVDDVDNHQGLFYNYRLNNGMMNSVPSPCGNSQGSADSQESSSMSTSPPSSVTMSPNGLVDFLNLYTPEQQLEYNIINLSAMQNIDSPFLTIVEEPIEKFRFRYKSEMNGAHGCLIGRKSDRQRKKIYPTVKLNNYDYPAVIRCSVWTDHPDVTQRCPHAHRLVKRNDQNDEVDDPHSVEVNQTLGYTATFPGMGILQTAKKYLVPELTRKKEERMIESVKNMNRKLSQIQITQIKEEAMKEAKSINLNVVSLCFECFTPDMMQICPPVFSSLISNMKSALTGELKITRMDRVVSSCLGNDEVFMLVEKVSKGNIKVVVYELDDEDNEVWSADCLFTPLDVHHQYAIVFRTPPYRDLTIETTKEVFIKLYRPSDKCCSNPRSFMYKPSDKTALLAAGQSCKRPRLDSSELDSSDPMFPPAVYEDEQEINDSFPSNTFENEVNRSVADSNDLRIFLQDNTDLEAMCENVFMDLASDGVRSRNRVRPTLKQYLKGEMEKPLWISPQDEDSPNARTSQDKDSPQKLPDRQSKTNPSSCVVQCTNESYVEEVVTSNDPQPELPNDLKSFDNSFEENSSSDTDSQLDDSRENSSSDKKPRRILCVPKMGETTLKYRIKLEPEDPDDPDLDPDGVENVPTSSQEEVNGKVTIHKKRREYTKSNDDTSKSVPVATIASSTTSTDSTSNTFEDNILPMTPDESQVLVCPAMSFSPNMITNDLLDSELFGSSPTDTPQEKLMKKVTEELAKLIRDKKNQCHMELVKIIHELFKANTINGETALHIAASHNDERYLNRMLAVLCAGRRLYGTEPCKEISDIVNAQNRKSETCLHMAILRNQHNAVKFLLMAGANPNIINHNGNAPLHLAINNLHEECIFELLRATNYEYSPEKVQLNIKNERGWPPLHLAALKHSWFTVSHLLNAGADPNERDNTGGRTVLHIAVEEQDKIVVKNLCAANVVKVDQQNLAGNTALHLAVAIGGFNSPAICKSLLGAGADPLLRNFNTERPTSTAVDGKPDEKIKDFRMTPLDIAKENTIHQKGRKKKSNFDILEKILTVLESWVKNIEPVPASNQNEPVVPSHKDDTNDYFDDSEDNSSSSSFSSESSEENGLFDRNTMQKLCTLLDKNKAWEKLIHSLEFECLLTVTKGTASPSRLVLNYADVYSAETPEIIRDHLIKLGELEAVQIINDMLDTIAAAKRGEASRNTKDSKN